MFVRKEDKSLALCNVNRRGGRATDQGMVILYFVFVFVFGMDGPSIKQSVYRIRHLPCATIFKSAQETTENSCHVVLAASSSPSLVSPRETNK